MIIRSRSASNGLIYFSIPEKLIVATSERRDGPMGFTDPVQAPVRERNRKRFLSRLGVVPRNLVRIKQVHGSRIVVVKNRMPAHSTRADGLFTKKRNIALSIVTADCVPIFFWDEKTTAVGIAHAGWRGVVKNIPREMVKVFQKNGIPPHSLHVFLGPSIKKCHFEIWPEGGHKELAPFVEKTARALKKRRYFFDLQGAICRELIRARVKKKNIHQSRECTFHSRERFFSYRRNNQSGERLEGHMLSVIGRPQKV